MTDWIESGHSVGEEPVFLARTKSFTRRSRELSPALARAFGKAASKYVVPVRRGVGMTSVHEDFRLDVAELFGRSAPLYVEVGPGRGEQIVASAARHPGINFLAFEVWVPGMARLVAAAAEQGLTNIKVIEADAQQALKTVLPEASVAEVWTNFPDPWRKSRHRKRRLVADDFAATVARVLEDGGIWRLATDWEDYAWQMLEVLDRTPELENPDQTIPIPCEHERPSLTGSEVPVDTSKIDGFAPRYPGRIVTHFEERGHGAGRLVWDLTAVRIPRDSTGESIEARSL